MLDSNSPLFQKAKSLTPLERLQLVDFILESLDMPDPGIEKLWADEASRRWEDYKSGKIDSTAAAEVFEKYRT